MKTQIWTTKSDSLSVSFQSTSDCRWLNNELTMAAAADEISKKLFMVFRTVRPFSQIKSYRSSFPSLQNMDTRDSF